MENEQDRLPKQRTMKFCSRTAIAAFPIHTSIYDRHFSLYRKLGVTDLTDTHPLVDPSDMLH